ncbi:MAG: Dabb family protein [Acidimicrobiia bacterium]|nr:Dabb family protein [Acidimicrobiia bacterium]
MTDPAIRHIVLFRFAEGTATASVAALHDALMGLPSTIPEIASYQGGPDLDLGPETWDYALVAEFRSVADYRTYAEHPEHVRVIEDHVKPIVIDVIRVQHEA